MPGVLVHLIAGSAMFFIGRYYFKNYFDNDHNKQLLLVITCLSFSFLPDIFLGIYYTTHILPREVLVTYHTIAHILFCPIAFVILLLMRSDEKRKPLWAMGLWSIILHLSMDLFMQETGPLF